MPGIHLIVSLETQLIVFPFDSLRHVIKAFLTSCASLSSPPADKHWHIVTRVWWTACVLPLNIPRQVILSATRKLFPCFMRTRDAKSVCLRLWPQASSGFSAFYPQPLAVRCWPCKTFRYAWSKWGQGGGRTTLAIVCLCMTGNLEHAIRGVVLQSSAAVLIWCLSAKRTVHFRRHRLIFLRETKLCAMDWTFFIRHFGDGIKI